MYEQPQVNMTTEGSFNDDTGHLISLETSDNTPIGKVVLTSLENAPNIDPAFIGMFDESKFQTIPLNYENSLFYIHLILTISLNNRDMGLRS
jgi:hypothetical protein